jgi:mannose-1-phosphate guanylyltransferase/mannose-6-phosphate isomerase
VLVVAADHLIEDAVTFRNVALSALPAAYAGRLVTFGVAPTHPATGYGYIEPGEPAEGNSFRVARFAEKPSAEIAAHYIAKGYLWNSGNFLFLPRALLAEYRSFHPATVAAVEQSLDQGVSLDGAVLLDRVAMEMAEKESIDYAVMERTGRAAVVKLSCGWFDIGSWDALWSLSEKDGYGNACSGDVECLESANSYVLSDGPLTALLGVSDLVVIAQRDAILVADRRRSADVKTIVNSLRSKGRCEADRHSRLICAWGWRQICDANNRSEIRRLVINPGGLLPMQQYDDRTLHWIAASGLIKATLSERSHDFPPNAHITVPAGTCCRLENLGETPAEVVEIHCFNQARSGVD